MTRPFSFRDDRAAFRFANNCRKMHIVIMGDDSCFWVVSMVEGERMIRSGYEVAVDRGAI